MWQKNKFITMVLGLIVFLFLLLFIFNRKNIYPSNSRKEIVEKKLPISLELPKKEFESRANSDNDLNIEEKVKGYQLDKNRKIEFYGKVVDENNNPIVGAKIEYSIPFFDGIVRPDFSFTREEKTIYSNKDGKFLIQKEKGLGISIYSITKEGFEFKDGGYFGYNFTDRGIGKPAPVISTSQSPLIFYGYKRGIADLIIHETLTGMCDFDGRIYTFDLLNGRIKEGAVVGDFQVACYRPSKIQGQEPYDWGVEISVTEGGVVMSDAPFMCKAPESGYSPKWNFSMNSNENKYTRKQMKNFFLKSRNRIYSRIEVEMISDYRDKFGIRAKYWLNPLGSTNLEYDEKKRIPRELIQEIGLEKAIEEVKRWGEEERKRENGE